VADALSDALLTIRGNTINRVPFAVILLKSQSVFSGSPNFGSKSRSNVSIPITNVVFG
jgi:hypothetical protein